MPRKVRTHITEAAQPTPQFAPKHLTKQEFGRRLYTLMIGRGWHQSELARRSGLPRDSISVYVRGKSLPTPLSLQALARAFDMEPKDLLPNQVESAIDEDMPALEMKVSPNMPNSAWLRVNQLVSIRTAVAVIELLERDHAVDGSGSSDAA